MSITLFPTSQVGVQLKPRVNIVVQQVPDDSYTSAGYGLCQATPGYKMASAGSDWATDPITQLKWCNGYAVSRYGGWYNAYVHWINNGNW
ncbi:MAG: hypothetical protein WDN66_03915 [Candidatus Saccharibacteria bacterium]